LAICSEVIEHVEAPERVIAYASAVLEPGGIFILTTPHDAKQWTTMDDYAGHVQRFSTAQLEALLEDFELLELATEGFPFQRVVMRSYDRMLARSGGEHNFDGFGESPAYRAYTIVMPLLLRFDHLLRGLRRGTTLVAVARKR
jgi:SAM-dependent methyltransferase